MILFFSYSHFRGTEGDHVFGIKATLYETAFWFHESNKSFTPLYTTCGTSEFRSTCNAFCRPHEKPPTLKPRSSSLSLSLSLLRRKKTLSSSLQEHVKGKTLSTCTCPSERSSRLIWTQSATHTGLGKSGLRE